jgi:drug/metabolite transporter (DMT)-like permease
VAVGLFKERLPFLRTAKGGATRKGPDFPAFWEAILAGLLLAGAATLVVTNVKEIREINIFAAVLVVQSLPFLAAAFIALVEGTRFNSLAYWRGIGVKAAVLLPQPKVIAEQPKLPSENRIETAQ